ncbi:site-specific integrase [Hydrogenobacter sp. T-2]|uniref:tyrosine-type recombinase/integrase n=1 Tax=Pampinifervens diazotrophicum TaxID=1632018 RepID=UPI002B25FDC3|nr:site-specific integrase [Hydrogenobacter sp. T-2]WPM32678.1 site-specific integrase [Hydrogenobacter sp. T-2]
MDRLLDLWVKSLSRTKSQRTVITYTMCLGSLQKYLGKKSSLLEIEPTELFSYVDSSNLSTSSLLTHLSAIKHFYKFAFRRGWLSKEHYSELEAVLEEIRDELSSSKPQKSPKALSREELDRIFQTVRDTKYERVYSLLLYSGVRLSEYVQLRRDFFYRDKSGIYWLRLPAEITKRGKERLVPIIGPSKEETMKINEKLDEWLEDYDAYIRVKAGSLQVYTNRLSQRLGISFSVHSFRHTYITNLVNSGFPAEVVKEFAGHSNVKTTIDIYYRFSQERAKSLVENFLR